MPPLETMVVTAPLISEKGVSQVCKDIPSGSFPPQLEQCKELKENIF